MDGINTFKYSPRHSSLEVLPPLRISLILVLLGTGGFTPGAVRAGFRIPLGVLTSSLILLLLLVCFSLGLSQPADNIHVIILIFR